MGVAVAVSVVHYVDNTVNYADYPQAESGHDARRRLTEPDARGGGVVHLHGVRRAWGCGCSSRGRIAAAAVAIAVYSGSGLVGFAHYAVPGATDMVWWRQAHVVADIVCGLLLFGFALWVAVDAQAFASVPRYSSMTFGSFMSCSPLAV